MTVTNPAAVLPNFQDTQNWTMNDACCGVLATGATGGGKTSGPGRPLARAYLRAGMGGLDRREVHAIDPWGAPVGARQLVSMTQYVRAVADGIRRARRRHK
jgi:hypothetical protein